jgi:hypothetical protein
VVQGATQGKAYLVDRTGSKRPARGLCCAPLGCSYHGVECATPLYSYSKCRFHIDPSEPLATFLAAPLRFATQAQATTISARRRRRLGIVPHLPSAHATPRLLCSLPPRTTPFDTLLYFGSSSQDEPTITFYDGLILRVACVSSAEYGIVLPKIRPLPHDGQEETTQASWSTSCLG